jgi:hypothetical protein
MRRRWSTAGRDRGRCSGDPQGPTFRGGVNVVRVDAIANDKKTGKPVLDLKPEEFEITEAGKKQTINTFKLISLDGGLMSTDGPPRPSAPTMTRKSRRRRTTCGCSVSSSTTIT